MGINKFQENLQMSGNIDAVIKNLLTTSGLSTTQTTRVPSTRKRPKSSLRRPSVTWKEAMEESSLRKTSRLASASSTRTSPAQSRRTRWRSSSRRLLDSESEYVSCKAILISKSGAYGHRVPLILAVPESVTRWTEAAEV